MPSPDCSGSVGGKSTTLTLDKNGSGNAALEGWLVYDKSGSTTNGAFIQGGDPKKVVVNAGSESNGQEMSDKSGLWRQLYMSRGEKSLENISRAGMTAEGHHIPVVGDIPSLTKNTGMIYSQDTPAVMPVGALAGSVVRAVPKEGKDVIVKIVHENNFQLSDNDDKLVAEKLAFSYETDKFGTKEVTSVFAKSAGNVNLEFSNKDLWTLKGEGLKNLKEGDSLGDYFKLFTPEGMSEDQANNTWTWITSFGGEGSRAVVGEPSVAPVEALRLRRNGLNSDIALMEVVSGGKFYLPTTILDLSSDQSRNFSKIDAARVAKTGKIGVESTDKPDPDIQQANEDKSEHMPQKVNHYSGKSTQLMIEDGPREDILIGAGTKGILINSNTSPVDNFGEGASLTAGKDIFNPVTIVSAEGDGTVHTLQTSKIDKGTKITFGRGEGNYGGFYSDVGWTGINRKITRGNTKFGEAQNQVMVQIQGGEHPKWRKNGDCISGWRENRVKGQL